MTSLLSRFNSRLLTGTAIVLAGGGAVAALGFEHAGFVVAGLNAAAMTCAAAAIVAANRTDGALKSVVTVLKSCCRGDLEKRVLDARVPGVVGELQEGVNDLLDVTDAFVREASGSMDYASRRKYFRRVLVRGLPGSFGTAAEVINRGTALMESDVKAFVGFAENNVASVAQGVSESAGQLRRGADMMKQVASHTDAEATAVAAATQQAAANVQTVAAAAEELSSSVSEISRQVAHSKQIAGKAVEEAKRTSAQVRGLIEATKKVEEIGTLISSIAERTNLLALNATIEAARSGEAGKGFAVVAGEVKSLAAQTSKATEQISRQMNEIRGTTEGALGAISVIDKTIGEMNEVSTSIAAAVEQQGVATQDIARNIQQAAQGTSSVLTSITSVTKGAAETGTAAAQTLTAATDLSGKAEKLKVEIGTFVAKTKAA